MLKNIPFLSGVYLFAVFLLSVDIYKSGTAVYKYTGIPSFIYGYVVCVLIILARVYWSRTINVPISKFNTFILFPSVFIGGVAFAVLGYVTPPNFMYSLIPVQVSQLVLMSIFCGIVTLTTQKTVWYSRHYAQLIFGSGIVIFFYALITSLLPFDVFAQLSKEDHIIEYAQVVMLTISAIYFFLFAKRQYERKRIVLGIIFFVASMVLALVAGDEISWGQRIFHLATPEWMVESNAQQEITIHNLSSVGSDKVNLGYILIGLYGSICWIIQHKYVMLKKYPYVFFITPWFATIYFFVGFAFNLYIRLNNAHTISGWAEFVEFMLYAGIAIYSIYLYYTHEKI